MMASFAAFAGQPSTVKVADGTSAYCTTKKDTESRANAKGFYRIKAKKAKMVGNDVVEVKVDISFLKCTKRSKQFTFREVGPLAPKSYFKTSNDLIIGVQAERIEVNAYKDGVYRIIDLAKHTIKENRGRQQITLAFPVETIINDGSQNRPNYDASVDVYITKTLRYTSPDGAINFLEDIAYGSYRIHMDLDLEKGTVKLK